MKKDLQRKNLLLLIDLAGIPKLVVNIQIIQDIVIHSQALLLMIPIWLWCPTQTLARKGK